MGSGNWWDEANGQGEGKGLDGDGTFDTPRSDAKVFAQSCERMNATISVTLPINSSGNMHTYTRHEFQQQKSRERPFKTSFKNSSCLTDISSHCSFRLNSPRMILLCSFDFPGTERGAFI
jgi:hypothetical protein